MADYPRIDVTSKIYEGFNISFSNNGYQRTTISQLTKEDLIEIKRQIETIL